MQTGKSILIFGLLVLLLMSATRLQADQPQGKESAELQTLIRDVEQQEALYRNLKLQMQLLYQQPLKPADPEKQVKLKSELTLIVQGDKYRQEKQTKGRFQQSYSIPPKKPYHQYSNGTQESCQVYDGETLQKFSHYDRDRGLTTDERQTGGYGDITHEQVRMENLLRPHMLLSYYGPRVPLSTWLKGTAAVAESPGLPNYNNGSSYKADILGEETVQGLKCIKVQIDRRRNSSKSEHRDVLWLARERNLLPVQAVTYQFSRSTDIPQSETWVDEWLEVRPGVWFPRTFHTDRLDWIMYVLKKKQQVGWQKAYVVESVELDPSLPADTFTKLEFPEGIVIDGKHLLKQK
ncbi:outer membrane lipoprotein-sorting protein [Gimesia chilikensis]|uniref:outer membrane lipoprotein-sorting protein n=1 Tax=Gimesia chilikensis TaxID=2605989 RepID=UPI00118A22C8|nr:outer membrane lipoprotein-sorting protein [Gimesia chilikensis]QDT86040.1 hypothetical protein MalM14_37140 [Gimesia chilikensis]